MKYYNLRTSEFEERDVGWFEGRICECKYFHPSADTPRIVPSNFRYIYICRDCGKWENNLHKCCKCGERYYQHFQHPRMGYHSKPLKGWYCWTCLEKWLPPMVSEMYREIPKTPPLRDVLTPTQRANFDGWLTRPARINKFAHLL